MKNISWVSLLKKMSNIRAVAKKAHENTDNEQQPFTSKEYAESNQEHTMTLANQVRSKGENIFQTEFV